MVGKSSLLVISLISVKYVYHQLGADALGIIYFTFMFNALLSTALGLGISPTLVREIAAHIDDDETYAHQLIQTASFIFWGIFFCICTIVFFLAPVIVSEWINVQSMPEDTAIFIIRVLSITSLLSLPQSVYVALLNGLQRMEYTNAIQVSVMLLQQIGVITILILDDSLLKVIYWIAGCQIILVIFYLSAAIHFVPAAALVPRIFLDAVKRNARFSINMGTVSVLAFLHTQVDKLIISKFLPLGALGYYSVAYNLTAKSTLVADSVSSAAYPVFCELFKSGTHQQTMTQYNKLQDVICYISAPILAFIVFYNQPIFLYLFDLQIAEMLSVPIIFLCAAAFLQVSYLAPHGLLLASGESGLALRASSLNLLISLPTAVIAIYLWGLTGAGIAYFVSRLFILMYLIPKLSRRCFRRSPLVWYFHILKIVSAVTMTYAFVWLLLDLSDIRSIYGITIGYFIASILYIGVAWFLVGKEFKSSLIELGNKTGLIAQ